jgi:hypothetical protein
MNDEKVKHLSKLFLNLFPEINDSLLCELCNIYTCSTHNWWLVLKDLSASNPEHKHMPGVNEYLTRIGDVLTAYIQQQCAAFLKKYPSEEAYIQASQKSSTCVSPKKETEEDFVLVNYEDAVSYKRPVRRK